MSYKIIKNEGKVFLVDVDGNTTTFVVRTSADELDSMVASYLSTNKTKYTSIEVAIKNKRKEIDVELSNRLFGVFNGNTFNIDDISAGRLNNALSVAETIEKLGETWPGVYWTDADNKPMLIKDINTLRDMVVKLGQQGSLIYAAWQTHKHKVSSLIEYEKVQTYDTSVGWPELGA